MKKIISWIFKIWGWKIVGCAPEGLKKCVVVVGPHTSNWDFIVGRMAFMMMDINGKYLIKSDLFFFPLGNLLRAIGGIPVDRKKNNNLTESAATMFEKEDELFLVFSPEGTRSYNPNWKKGFYYIALKAKVPILIGYIDFSTKTGGFHSILEPSGNVQEDIQKIKNILKDYKGKYPEKGIIS